MKSAFWKKLIVLVFIFSIGCYVAYRVGAFDGILKDKNVEKVSAKVKPENDAPTKVNSSEIDDSVFSSPKSAPIMKSNKDSSKSQKPEKTSNHQKNVDLMPGSKSGLFEIDLEDLDELENESEKAKQNIPSQNQKNSSK